MKIRLGSISVDSVTNQSGIYYGANRQSDIKTSHKENDGFGEIKGQSNVYRNNVEIVFDDDDLDMWTGPSGGNQDE